MPLPRFIPAGATKVADKQSDAVAYIYTSGRLPCARVFFGKQGKPVAAFRYRSEADRERSVADYFGRRRTWLRDKEEQTAKRRAYRSDYQVGEVLVCSWGYEQTNVDWYEVVAVRGQMVDIRRIRSKYIETCGNMSGQCVPLPGDFVSDVLTKKATEHGLKMTSYSTACRAEFTLVAGLKVYKPRYESHYA